MTTTLTPKRHKQRHIRLHGALDELVADFVTHTEKSLGKATVLDLIQWSHKQTYSPSTKE